MLNATWKKILLSAHILLIGIWIGCLSAIVLVILAGDLLTSQTTVVAASKVIFVINDYVIMNVSTAVAVTGLLFSTFTQWGFIKYWWIILKWIAIVGLAVFLLLYYAPVVNNLAGISNVFGKDVTFSADYLKLQNDLLFYSVTQLVLLFCIIIISVFKPWGKRNPKHNFNRKAIVSVVVVLILLLLTGVSFQYYLLHEFRNIEIGEVDLTKIENGIYPGETDLGFLYKVNVIVQNNKITDIEYIQNRTSTYAKLAEKVRRKIIKQQKINVDAVTGATTTSKALLKAIYNALHYDDGQ